MTKTSKVSGEVTLALLAVGLAGALGGATSCGGVSGSDVVNARNQATTASCNYYMMCNQIGPGMSAKGDGYYDSYQDCTTKVLAAWTSAWPTTTCEGHIDQAALTLCLNAIGGTTCNGLDVLLTLSKCGSGTVCDANVKDAAAGN
jgi:Family of unknown function (DUF6184)